MEIGKNTTFKALLNNKESDKLNFTVNGIVGATVNITDAGDYVVVVTFVGNATHKAASATRTFSIGKEDVNVTIDDVELVIGKNATFTGKVNGISNKNLTFIVNGVLTDNITVVAGTYTVTATFQVMQPIMLAVQQKYLM